MADERQWQKVTTPRRIRPNNPKSSYVPQRDGKQARRNYYIRKERGVEALAPVDRVREHIIVLMDKGMSINMIARAGGVSHEVVRLIRNGESERVTRHVWQGVMKVTHVPHPEQGLVLLVGVVRRVQALQALGWTAAEVATRLGWSPQYLSRALRRKYSTYETWKAVHDLYEQLSHIPGPSKIARRNAAAAGWPAPLDWEDLDIDDPHVTPDVPETPKRPYRRKAS